MIVTPDNPVVWLLLEVLNIYWWVVVIAVVISWLVAFGVLNTYNQFARSVIRAVNALTEPVFRQVRRIIPSIGGLDLSPLIVLFAIMFLQKLIVWAAERYLYGAGSPV